MKCKISYAQKPIKAQILIPGSKSMTNRALLLAALAEGQSELFDILLSDDTRTFITALQALGITIEINEAERSCVVTGCNGQFPQTETQVWCADAGTAARFLTAACSATEGVYEFDGSEQLRKRPILPLLRALANQGVKISPPHAERMPFTLEGRDSLPGGEIEIAGEETSQFLSGILMIAPYAKATTNIVSHTVVSRPYVEMTMSIMADFGVMVRQFHLSRFSIPPRQHYTGRSYRIEPDLSTASYFFAAAAVTGGEIQIQGIDRENSKQGDVEFLTVLEKMGCEVKSTESGLIVKGTSSLKGVNVDMRDFSDTFMTLAAIAPFASSPTTMTNISHTRYQESNRISVMRQELENLGVKVEEGEDWLKVYPSEPQPGVVNSHFDHRIAMAFSIIGLRVQGIEIDRAECVAKTCPEFFELWAGLTVFTEN